MKEVLEDREVWRLNLKLQSPQPSRKKLAVNKKVLRLFVMMIIV